MHESAEDDCRQATRPGAASGARSWNERGARAMDSSRIHSDPFGSCAPLVLGAHNAQRWHPGLTVNVSFIQIPTSALSCISRRPLRLCLFPSGSSISSV